MNEKLFSEALSLIDERYIEEALTYEPERKTLPRRSWGSVAACILLGLFLTGSLILTLSPEARAAVLGWVRRQTDDTWIEYRFEGVPTSSAPVDFAPTWVPEGYEHWKTVEMMHSKSYLYVNEDTNLIGEAFYIQNTENSGQLLAMDTAGYAQKNVTIHGLPGTMYISPSPQESSGIVWRDDANSLLFYVKAGVGEEDLIRFAEGFLPVVKDKLAPAMYCPTWVPNDFILQDSFGDKDSQDYVYFTGTGDTQHLAHISCIGVSEQSTKKLYISPEDGDHFIEKAVTITGFPGTLYLSALDSDSSLLVWEDPENQLLFSIKAFVSEADLIRIAESFLPVNEVRQKPTLYCPSWNPDGFELDYSEKIAGGEAYIYRGPEKKSILFSYEEASTSCVLAAEAEGYEQKKAVINGCSADLYLSPTPDETSLIVWVNQEDTLFYINGHLSEEELIQMAEGVHLKP